MGRSEEVGPRRQIAQIESDREVRVKCLEVAYQRIPAIDLSRQVLTPQPHRLLAVRDTTMILRFRHFRSDHLHDHGRIHPQSW